MEGQVIALANEPEVAGGQIGLAHGPVGVVGDGFRVRLDGPPEVGEKGVFVVDGFEARRVRAAEEDGTRTEEWLDVVFGVPEPLPDERGGPAFSAEPGEGGAQSLGHV